MSFVEEEVKKRIYVLLVSSPSSRFQDSERTTFIACMFGQQRSSMQRARQWHRAVKGGESLLLALDWKFSSARRGSVAIIFD